MELTAEQTKQLRVLRAFRDKPPTIRGYFRTGWKNHLLLGVLCCGAAVFYAWAGWPIASGFLAGILLGVIVRDLGWYRKIVRSWPLSSEITDWRRVDELLGKQSG